MEIDHCRNKEESVYTEQRLEGNSLKRKGYLGMQWSSDILLKEIGSPVVLCAIESQSFDHRALIP